jgi:hypothetical protein
MSLRNIQICILKIFGLELSLGFVYEEVKRVCKKARQINEKIRGLVKLAHVVADEVWIKVKQTSKKWSYAFLLASPKSLFIWSLDHLVKRDEVSMGLKIIEYIERGLNPAVFGSDLLKTYKIVAKYFKDCLHQLCTNHGIKALHKIVKDLPAEARQDKFFYDYIKKLRDRFIDLFELDDIIEIEQKIKQMRKVLSLWQGKRGEWARPMLDFIDRNWEGLFWYKRYPEKEIENTNNGAEIINSLFKPHYKIMKHLERKESTQDHLETFVLRNNIRVFQRGKRKGYSPLQLEGIPTKVTDWTELIWGEDPEGALKDIEVSMLLKDLQGLRGASRLNKIGAISFPETSRERGEKVERGWKEMPVEINRKMLNNYIQCKN